MAKESLKKQFKEAQKEPKQLVVGGIIFLVAILLLVFSFIGEKTPLRVNNSTSETKVTKTAEKPAVVAEKTETEVVSQAPVASKENIKTPENTEETVAEKEIVEVEPQNVVVNFTATLEKNFTFQIFYTEEADEGYAENKSVKQAGTLGTRTYSIVLPVGHISGFRLDYGENPGQVSIRDIKLVGSQTADLNNFSEYDTNQMENININEDGSLSFTSEGYDPYMMYKTKL
jgi:hypothetical protein